MHRGKFDYTTVVEHFQSARSHRVDYQNASNEVTILFGAICSSNRNHYPEN